jgi:hypothetical protein
MWAAGEEYARAVPLYLRTQTDVGLEKSIAVVEKVGLRDVFFLVMVDSRIVSCL